MAGFEDLIRGALSKQVNPTAETREKIYDSARQALMRMLDGNDALAPDVAENQRAKLEDAIKVIETDYGTLPGSAPTPSPPSQQPAPQSPPSQATPSPATPSPIAASSTPPTPKAPDPAPTAQPSAPPPPAQQKAPEPATPVRLETLAVEQKSIVEPATVKPVATAAKPSVVMPTMPSAKAAPEVRPKEPPRADVPQPSVSTTPPTPNIPEPPAAPTEEADYPDAYIGDALREKRPYAKLLLWTIILVGIGVGIWWAYSNGRAYLDQELGGGVPNPPRILESGSSVGAQDEEGWITVFAPQDNAQDVGTPGAGAAELQQDGNRPVMRLASPDAALKNNLLIRLPRGSMLALKGKSATFELVVRSGGDEEQSFVIFCNFGAMGECGRKRFNANSNPRPILFDVLINDTDLKSDEEAFISLNTDFEGTGRALDLYSIRVRESG